MQSIRLAHEELSDLIGLTYDSAFEKVQWQSLLMRLSELFPGIGAVAYGLDNDTILPAFAKAGAGEAYFSKPVVLDFKNKSNMTTAEAMELTPNGFVTRVLHYVDEDDWVNSTVYKEHVAREGFHRSIHMKVDHNGRRSALLAFCLPKYHKLENKLHDQLFDVLKLLAPHAVRASQLARALALAKKSTEAFSGFLDGITLPMLVTDVNGKYLFANAAGRSVLERSDPFRLGTHGRLELSETYETADLYHKIAQTDRHRVQSGMRVETEQSPLMLAISPFRPSMREASAIDRHLFDEERMFAIFVGQSTQDAVNAALLEDVFELTTREAQICKRMLMGESVATIAEMSERSTKTVRNQIQMIYNKVGVSSNTELMDTLSVFRTVGTMFESGTAGVPPAAISQMNVRKN